jgi:hypothetical protein
VRSSSNGQTGDTLARDCMKDAEYNGKTKALQMPGKGVGCIAEQKIPTGQLILRERAFAAAQSQTLTNSMGLLIDFSSKICLAGNELALVGKIVRLIRKSKASRSALFQLWSGIEERHDETVEIDGNPVIDMSVIS